MITSAGGNFLRLSESSYRAARKHQPDTVSPALRDEQPESSVPEFFIRQFFQSSYACGYAARFLQPHLMINRRYELICSTVLLQTSRLQNPQSMLEDRVSFSHSYTQIRAKWRLGPETKLERGRFELALKLNPNAAKTSTLM
jgi:hypothetical protein